MTHRPRRVNDDQVASLFRTLAAGVDDEERELVLPLLSAGTADDVRLFRVVRRWSLWQESVCSSVTTSAGGSGSGSESASGRSVTQTVGRLVAEAQLQFHEALLVLHPARLLVVFVAPLFLLLHFVDARHVSCVCVPCL